MLSLRGFRLLSPAPHGHRSCPGFPERERPIHQRFQQLSDLLSSLFVLQITFLIELLVGIGDQDFGLTAVAGYFDAKNFTVICYGSTLQLPVSDPLYDLAALRAQNVCDSYITTQYKFTELKTHYQNAADDYQIQDFNPHPAACSACGGN